MKDVTRLLALDSENANYYFLRGVVNEKLSKMEGAIEDYSAALRLNPNHVNAAYARGSCQNLRGNFQQAIEDYNMALEKDEGRFQMMFSPARGQYQTQRFQYGASLFLLDNILTRSARATPRNLSASPSRKDFSTGGVRVLPNTGKSATDSLRAIVKDELKDSFRGALVYATSQTRPGAISSESRRSESRFSDDDSEELGRRTSVNVSVKTKDPERITFSSQEGSSLINIQLAEEVDSSPELDKGSGKDSRAGLREEQRSESFAPKEDIDAKLVHIDLVRDGRNPGDGKASTDSFLLTPQSCSHGVGDGRTLKHNASGLERFLNPGRRVASAKRLDIQRNTADTSGNLKGLHNLNIISINIGNITANSQSTSVRYLTPQGSPACARTFCNGARSCRARGQYMTQAQESYSAGHYKNAILLFNKVIEGNPSNWEALLFRGLAHLSLGQAAEAMSDLGKAEALSPENAQVQVAK